MIKPCYLAPLLMVLNTAAMAKDNAEWAIESRLYAADEQAFGLALTTDYLGLKWHLGGYTPFDMAHNDELDGSEIDYGVTKQFNLANDFGFSLGVGALGSDVYTDYQFNLAVTHAARLQTGYRFHFDEHFVNRNEFYLGFRYVFNAKAPQAIVPPEPEPQVIVKTHNEPAPFTLNQTLTFKTSSDDVIDPSVLDSMVREIKQAETWRMTVTGHTDSTGSDALNERLSKRRAQSVADYFVMKGLEKEHITVVGAGARYPMASNGNQEGRAMNRRVTIDVNGSLPAKTSGAAGTLRQKGQ